MHKKWFPLIFIFHLFVNHILCHWRSRDIWQENYDIIFTPTKQNFRINLHLMILILFQKGGISYMFTGKESKARNAIVNTYNTQIYGNVYRLQYTVQLLSAPRCHKNKAAGDEFPWRTPGTGKNYVADCIVKHFYCLQDKSKHVNTYRGLMDFPLASEVYIYRVIV